MHCRVSIETVSQHSVMGVLPIVRITIYIIKNDRLLKTKCSSYFSVFFCGILLKNELLRILKF